MWFLSTSTTRATPTKVWPHHRRAPEPRHHTHTLSFTPSPGYSRTTSHTPLTRPHSPSPAATPPPSCSHTIRHDRTRSLSVSIGQSQSLARGLTASLGVGHSPTCARVQRKNTEAQSDTHARTFTPPHTRLLYALVSLFRKSSFCATHATPLAQRGASPSCHRSLLVFRFHMETRSWTLFLLPSPRLSVTQLTSLSHAPSSLLMLLSLHLNLTQVVVVKVPLARRQTPPRS